MMCVSLYDMLGFIHIFCVYHFWPSLFTSFFSSHDDALLQRIPFSCHSLVGCELPVGVYGKRVFRVMCLVVAYIFVYNKPEYKEAKKRLEKVSEESDFVLYSSCVVSKRTSDVVASNEEKKHKKLIQKLKDEERVWFRFC